MTPNQIKMLKLLGYKKSDEEGAILYHPYLEGMGAYVWKNDKYTDILASHNLRLEKSIRITIASEIERGMFQ